MDKQPLVSVVILNWKGLDDTLRCIESVNQIDYSNYEIIVVDNESAADSYEAILKAGIKTENLITHEKNLGFTGGEISALPLCKGEFIFLLNNDAVIERTAIKNAVKTMKTDPKIAVVGGRSYVLDDDHNRHTIHFYSYQTIDPITAEVVTHTKDDNKVCEVSNLSGASVLIRRKAIEHCGYFDPRFFAYYEETDLFSRFRRAGWRIVYDPTVLVWHKHGASTKNKKYMYHYYMLRNQFIFAYKNFDKESINYFLKYYHRNFRRSLKVYLKNFRNLEPYDYIHKARVMSTLRNYVSLPFTFIQRRQNLRTNPDFSLNEALLEDSPLPVSIFVDATNISPGQKITLERNLQAIIGQTTKPAEVIVISKDPVKMPLNSVQCRMENIIDKGIFDMQPLDYFFMASNSDTLIFSNNEMFNSKLTSGDNSFQNFLTLAYKEMAGHELAAIVQSDYERFTRKLYLTGSFKLVALRKTYLVHYLTDHTLIDSLNPLLLSYIVGESLAHCRPIRTYKKAPLFLGLNHQPIQPTQVSPLLKKSVLWNLKRIFIRLHIMWLLKKGTPLIGRLLTRSLRCHPSQGKDNNLTKPGHELLQYSVNFPVIINTRDRYEPLMELVGWLEALGHKRVMFVDNDSVYPPLLDYFRRTPYQVVKLGRNGLQKAPWESMGVRFASKGIPYIVSDPDIIPDKDCPRDVIKHFTNLLNKYPQVNKVGFGLHIDDLPDSYAQKEHVMQWESRYWDESLLLEPGAYKADLDTTLALYRPRTWWFLTPSIRTGGKYMARHEPWYQDSSNPTEDFLFYAARASKEVTTWAANKLPVHHLRALQKEGFIKDFVDEEIK